MTAGERLKMLKDAALAEKIARTHVTAASEAHAGVRVSGRHRLRIAAPSRNYEADRRGEWNCCIAEDAPIWKARREGTRVWRMGEEVRDE